MRNEQEHHEWALNYYGVERLPVKHFPQINNCSCGAASLQMIYDFYGKEIPQKEIWGQIKSRKPGRKGEYYATTYSLARHARKLGFDTFTGKIKLEKDSLFNSNHKVIDSFLDRTINTLKIPLIICWRSPETFTGHFSVISGYNGMQSEVLDPFSTAGDLHLNSYLSHFWQPESFQSWEIPDGYRPSHDVIGGIFLAIFPKGKLKKFPLPRVEGTRVFKNL